MGIYCIENIINNKKYVGSSKNIYHRLHKHKSQLKLKQHQNSYLQNTVNKHKIENFKCYILQETNKQEMLKIEQSYIDTGNYAYNLNLSATTTILQESSKKLISKKLKEGYLNGTIQPTKTCAIEVYDLEGNFIDSFATIIETSKKLGIYIGLINKVLNGRQHHTHKLQFKRKKETKIITNILLNSNGQSQIKAGNKTCKSCTLYNIKTKEKKKFNSIKDCSKYLNVNYNTLVSSIKISKNPFKGKYIIKYTASQ